MLKQCIVWACTFVILTARHSLQSSLRNMPKAERHIARMTAHQQILRGLIHMLVKGIPRRLPNSSTVRQMPHAGSVLETQTPWGCMEAPTSALAQHTHAVSMLADPIAIAVPDDLSDVYVWLITSECPREQEDITMLAWPREMWLAVVGYQVESTPGRRGWRSAHGCPTSATCRPC